MASLHRLGRGWWWHTARCPPALYLPLHEVQQPMEPGFPWRVGTAHLFRLWPTRLVISVGKWTHRQEQEIDEHTGQATLLMRTIEDWKPHDWVIQESNSSDGSDFARDHAPRSQHPD